MKNRLGRGATIAAGAVAVSLFFLLCLMFYGREDYLAPERALGRHDAFRFRIASGLVGPFGAGAFLALGIAFAWSVIAYFRESVGSVVPRLVGIAACVPSFCALTSLASDPHEFWAGSVGIWMGDLCFRGFGPLLSWAVVGTLFLVSFALATEFGFHGQLAALRGTLAFPLVPPAEPEAAVSGAAGTAVLEPGVDLPAEPWALPEPDLRGGDDPEEEFSGAEVVEREEHLADIRRRLTAGEPVTDAERRLVEEARERAEMGAAIDALFTPVAPAPAAPATAAPPAPATPVAALPDLPPFLLPSLYSQQMASDAPAGAAAAAAPADAAPAAGPAPAPRGTKHPTEDLGEAPFPTPSRSYIFAGVEFLPPNEELADPHADAPAGAPAEPEPAPAAAAAPAPEAAPAPAGAAADAAPVFEDEFFSYGLAPEEAAAAAESTAAHEAHAAAAALVFTPSPVEEVPPAVAEAIAAPVPADDPAVDDGSWLLAAARDLGLEPVAEGAPLAEVEEDLSASVEIPALGGMSPEEAAEAIVASLRDLFGEPLVIPPAPAEEEAPTPAAEAVVEDEASLPFPESPAASEETPTHAPPPVPTLPDSTMLPSFAAPADRTDDAPVFDPGEEIAAPAPAEPRTYEPEPMTIEPEYLPNQDPEPGETVRFEAPYVAEPPAEGFVEERLSPPEVEVEPESVSVPSPSPADEILARLFGEPLPPRPEAAAEESPAPVGPVQPEPREPPANLQPILAEVADRVTLLDDPDLGDCARDHGIEAAPVHDDEVFSPPPPVVVDEPAALADAPADEVPEEPAVDEALVRSLVEEFRADETPAVEPEPEAGAAPAASPAGKDDLYLRAVAAVRERGRGSVIVLQRKLGIGYTRAVRLLAELVRDGVLGPENASGSHPVI